MKKDLANTEYLKRCKKTSAQSKLRWMADAFVFAKTPKTILVLNGKKVK